MLCYVLPGIGGFWQTNARKWEKNKAVLLSAGKETLKCILQLFPPFFQRETAVKTTWFSLALKVKYGGKRPLKSRLRFAS